MELTKSDKDMNGSSRCQMYSLPTMAEPSTTMEELLFGKNRLKRFLKRRYRYLLNICAEITRLHTAAQTVECSSALTANFSTGDLVRVKSREEIRKTLDRWNQLKKCSFMEEMHHFCGTHQRVLKRVDKFLDERDYRTKRCRGIYLLEGVLCQGTVDFGPCDRSCFFFWREEWLEKSDGR